ncbi:hypothetical protein LEMLEM_LOCUS21043 [Lemmus lemmus]
MSLWVDKYRPCCLARLDDHKEQAAQLRNLTPSKKKIEISNIASNYTLKLIQMVSVPVAGEWCLLILLKQVPQERIQELPGHIVFPELEEMADSTDEESKESGLCRD